jgi:hypothetical protein
MRTFIFSFAAVSALSTLSACGPSPDAVWLITLDGETSSDTTATCEENLIDANCPAGGGGEPPEFTITTERVRSGAALFVQILDGPDGEKYLINDQDVLVGTREDGVWTFTWEGLDETDSTRNHRSDPYTYRTERIRRRTTTISLELSGSTATGTIEEEAYDFDRVEESDTWSIEQVGLTFGQLAPPTPLEGDTSNIGDAADCAATPCFVESEETTTTTIPIMGYRTDLDREGFDGVEDAFQEFGSGTTN